MQALSEVGAGVSPTAIDLLKMAYADAVYPDPFSIANSSRGEKEIAMQRLSEIPFAQYWTDIFAQCAQSYGNPAGPFAAQAFRLAEKFEGEVLLKGVAEALAGRFGLDTLSAIVVEDQLPEAKKIVLHPGATHLVEIQEYLDEILIPKSPLKPQSISREWIELVNKAEEARLCPRISKVLNLVSRMTTDMITAHRNITNGEPHLGSDVFSQRAIITNGVAGVLAGYFPDIVLRKLRRPPNLEQ